MHELNAQNDPAVGAGNTVVVLSYRSPNPVENDDAIVARGFHVCGNLL